MGTINQSQGEIKSNNSKWISIFLFVLLILILFQLDNYPQTQIDNSQYWLLETEINPPDMKDLSEKPDPIQRDYEIIYWDDTIIIHEKFMGTSKTLDWSEFSMPETRVPFTRSAWDYVQNIAEECLEQVQTQKICTISLDDFSTTNNFCFLLEKIFGETQP